MAITKYRVEGVVFKGFTIAGYKVVEDTETEDSKKHGGENHGDREEEKGKEEIKTITKSKFYNLVEKGKVCGVKMLEYNGEKILSGVDYNNLSVSHIKADAGTNSFKNTKGLLLSEEGTRIIV